MSEQKTPEEMQERLDELGNDIEAVRQQARDADILDDPDEPRFYEEGDIHPELDDPTVAPPG